MQPRSREAEVVDVSAPLHTQKSEVNGRGAGYREALARAKQSLDDYPRSPGQVLNLDGAASTAAVATTAGDCQTTMVAGSEPDALGAMEQAVPTTQPKLENGIGTYPVSPRESLKLEVEVEVAAGSSAALREAEEWVARCQESKFLTHTGGATYPGGVVVPFSEWAPWLAAVSLANVAQREKAVRAMESAEVMSLSLRTFRLFDAQGSGRLGWAQGVIRDFVQTVFREMGLTPPHEGHIYPVYALFDSDRSMLLSALHCVCLVDALLRASFAAEEWPTSPATHATRPASSTGCAADPNYVCIDPVEVAKQLEPVARANARHRARMLQALQSGEVVRSALEMLGNPECQQYEASAWSIEMAQDVALAVFRRWGLSPPSAGQMQLLLQRFAKEADEPLDAQGCLCFIDALFRAVFTTSGGPQALLPQDAAAEQVQDVCNRMPGNVYAVGSSTKAPAVKQLTEHPTYLAEQWVASYTPLPVTGTVSVSYSSGVIVIFSEFAEILAPLALSNRAQRTRILQMIESGHLLRMALRTYQTFNENSGYLSWSSGRIHDFVVEVFGQHNLKPPSATQVFPLYAKFDVGQCGLLNTSECLCLVDAFFRATFHTEAGLGNPADKQGEFYDEAQSAAETSAIREALMRAESLGQRGVEPLAAQPQDVGLAEEDLHLRSAWMHSVREEGLQARLALRRERAEAGEELAAMREGLEAATRANQQQQDQASPNSSHNSDVTTKTSSPNSTQPPRLSTSTGVGKPVAESWRLPSPGASSATYLGRVHISFASFALALWPSVTANAPHRSRMLEVLGSSSLVSSTMQAFHECDVNGTGSVSWADGGIQNLVTNVFQQHGLSPPGKGHIHQVLMRFDAESGTGCLSAVECLCLLDALLRSIFHADISGVGAARAEPPRGPAPAPAPALGSAGELAPVIAASHATYLNKVRVNLPHFAARLAATVVANAEHRDRMLAAVNSGAVMQAALQIFQGFDGQGAGFIVWGTAAIPDFVASVFRQHGLAPPARDQIYEMYQLFDPDGQMRLYANECLCLLDALLRATFHAEQPPAAAPARQPAEPRSEAAAASIMHEPPLAAPPPARAPRSSQGL